jgi:hypothetical protein
MITHGVLSYNSKLKDDQQFNNHFFTDSTRNSISSLTEHENVIYWLKHISYADKYIQKEKNLLFICDDEGREKQLIYEKEKHFYNGFWNIETTEKYSENYSIINSRFINDFTKFYEYNESVNVSGNYTFVNFIGLQQIIDKYFEKRVFDFKFLKHFFPKRKNDLENFWKIMNGDIKILKESPTMTDFVDTKNFFNFGGFVDLQFTMDSTSLLNYLWWLASLYQKS